MGALGGGAQAGKGAAPLPENHFQQEKEANEQEIDCQDDSAVICDADNSGGRGDDLGRFQPCQPASNGERKGVDVGDLARDDGAVSELAHPVRPASKVSKSAGKRSPESQRKKTRSPESNVVYDPRLLTGEQSKKTKDLAGMLTGEQTLDIKSIMPALTKGFWWDVPADDKGFKIKLRWRDEQKKQKTYVFRRLGKYELQTLREQNYADQCADLADRLTGELLAAGRADLAARFTVKSQNNQKSGEQNQAIA